MEHATHQSLIVIKVLYHITTFHHGWCFSNPLKIYFSYFKNSKQNIKYKGFVEKRSVRIMIKSSI